MGDPVGEAVGRRVRRRRRLLGMTQQELGAACGVTFQQIQKYESASCRVSATVLWRLSQALDVDMNYFFAGLESETRPAETERQGPERSYLRLAV